MPDPTCRACGGPAKRVDREAERALRGVWCPTCGHFEADDPEAVIEYERRARADAQAEYEQGLLERGE